MCRFGPGGPGVGVVGSFQCLNPSPYWALWHCCSGAACCSRTSARCAIPADEANPYCPDGLDCIGGVCWRPAAATWQMVPGGTDGGASVAGCRLQRRHGLRRRRLCLPGVFSSTRANGAPKTSELCAYGRQHLQHARMANLTLCNFATRFFGSTQPARHNGGGRGNNNYSCQSSEQRSGSRRPGLRTVDAESGHGQELCRVHSRCLDCNNVTSWGCYGSTHRRQPRQQQPADGVLCCRRSPRFALAAPRSCATRVPATSSGASRTTQRLRQVPQIEQEAEQRSRPAIGSVQNTLLGVSQRPRPAHRPPPSS